MEMPELVDYVRRMYKLFKEMQEQYKEEMDYTREIYYSGLVSAYKDILDEIDP